MEIWEINLIGKGVYLYFPRWIQQTHKASFLELDPKGAPSIQNGDETTKTPGRRNSNMGHVGSKDLQEDRSRRHQSYDLPTWGQIKTLTNQVKHLVSQQEMPQSPENLLTMLAPLACTTPA